MVTIDKIEALKQDWLRDPFWDLEETDGFEDHREELSAFQAAMEKKWEAEEHARRLKQAEEWGVSAEITEMIERLNLKARNSAEKAKSLMVHYMGLALGEENLDSDNTLELKGLVDFIIDAALAQCKADLFDLIKAAPVHDAPPICIGCGIILDENDPERICDECWEQQKHKL